MSHDSTRTGSRKVPNDIHSSDLMASELYYQSSQRPCDNPKLNFDLIRESWSLEERETNPSYNEYEKIYGYPFRLPERMTHSYPIILP